MVTFRSQDAIAVSNSPTTIQLPDILSAIAQLAVEDKATLVNHVLGNNGLSIVLGSPTLSSYSIVNQIQGMDNREMGDILEAITQNLKDTA